MTRVRRLRTFQPVALWISRRNSSANHRSRWLSSPRCMRASRQQIIPFVLGHDVCSYSGAMHVNVRVRTRVRNWITADVSCCGIATAIPITEHQHAQRRHKVTRRSRFSRHLTGDYANARGSCAGVRAISWPLITDRSQLADVAPVRSLKRSSSA